MKGPCLMNGGNGMHFYTATKEYRFYRISLISGPKHYFLGLSFTDKEEQVRMLAGESCTSCSNNLDPAEIKEQVLKGIEEANQRLGTQYRINCIEYMLRDSGPVSVYAMLANCIVQHMHRLGDEYGKTKLEDFFFLRE